ncbi:MAG: dihydrolipoyl dehydrogenase family protein, partial [Candidatus Anammoxibacter sp.]
MRSFDVCVIGCGPGGFAAAMRCIDFGMNVCIVEANHIGGSGVMHGAMTSKTMWELSKDYATANRVDRGYRASSIKVEYSEVRKTVLKAAKEKQYQMLSQIETFSPGKSDNGSVILIQGYARFKDMNHVIIEKRDGDLETIKADYFIIASGSRPTHIPGIEVDQQVIIDSEGILNLKEFPERMLIVGGGVVGCEFATVFSNFGQTEVHILDKAERILPFEDDDVSSFIAKNFEDNGVTIHHEAMLRTIEKHGDHLDVIIDFRDGHTRVIEVDVALISIGRSNNVTGFGLEKLGIEKSKFNSLFVNAACNCTKNIYAAGDITGHAALVSIAEMEGRYAARAIAGKLQHPINYANMATIMFFKPEIAAVGLNEKKCKELKIPYKVAYYSNQLVSRAIAMRAYDGFVKILINKEGEFLGMRAAGPHAAANTLSFAQLMDQNKTFKDAMRTVHP